LFGGGDIEIASIALLEVYSLIRLEYIGFARRAAWVLGSIMSVRHRLEMRRSRRRRRGWHENGETAYGESAWNAETCMLPELSGDADLVLGEEDDEDAEGFGDAVLHDASEDVACYEECATCFGSNAGREE
jgi:hypothetical protein